jgi:hypothetical protein
MVWLIIENAAGFVIIPKHFFNVFQDEREMFFIHFRQKEELRKMSIYMYYHVAYITPTWPSGNALFCLAEVTRSSPDKGPFCSIGG